MKIGIYDQHIHRMGGGEQYICTIAEFLSKEHTVELLTTNPADKKILCDKLNLDLSRVKLIILPSDIESDNSEYTKQYDLFINGSYYSKLINYAPVGIIIIFFPILNKHNIPKFIKHIIYTILHLLFKNKSEPFNNVFLKRLYLRYLNEQYYQSHDEYLSSYKTIISISKYTQLWIKKNSSKNSIILYSPVNIKEGNLDKKQNILISVGRFFNTDHNKKQLEMIKLYKRMYDANLSIHNFEYHLCGGTQKEKIHMDYYDACFNEAKGYPIYLHPDISYDELNALYMHSKIFWHATGLNENINKNPDKFEHFGITTVEAMSAGVVPVVIGKAGQKETVTDGLDGYLWTSENECIYQTLKLISDDSLLSKMSKQAIISSQKYSKHNFGVNLNEILSKII